MLNRWSSSIVLILLFAGFRSSLEQLQSARVFPEERGALLRLRSSLGLRAVDWPIKLGHCSNWTGIGCRSGVVVRINISGFQRTRLGRLNRSFSVDALANLTFLELFNASHFSLPGSIPLWLGRRVSALQVLDLSSCNVSGTIPSSLGDLRNLSALYLSENMISGTIPMSLGQLSLLSVLDLSKNMLTGVIPSSFSSLRNISVFDASSNMLMGSIPVGIGSLAGLQQLNLSNNNLSASIPGNLGGLTGLVELDLSFNRLSGSLPRSLRGLRGLKRLRIGNNNIGGVLVDDIFKQLNHLESLVLRGNNFSGVLPDILWRMSNLSFLDISVNNFTGKLPRVTVNGSGRAAVINLSDNYFYGGITTVLMMFAFVDISGNYLEGKVPDYARSNATLDDNCLRNLSNQRSLADCQRFYKQRGYIFDNFGDRNESFQPPRRHMKSKRRSYVFIGALAAAGLVVFLFLVIVFIVVHHRRRDGSTNQVGNRVPPVSNGGNGQAPAALIDLSMLGSSFTYQQILLATGDFDDTNLLKHGHSGDLFRGTLENGIPVVIKRVDLHSVKKEAYMSELEFHSRVSHSRILPLLGHHLENEDQKYLVYRYMPNGDLANCLTKEAHSAKDVKQSLDWITRLKIAIGIAEGLSHLHHECVPAVVHRDIQASSILLDDKFEVRLGSLSEVCAQDADSHQSMISKILRLPQTSEQGSSGGSPWSVCAQDVYSLGRVLLELVTGKTGMGEGEGGGKEVLEKTLGYVNVQDKELVMRIVDPSMMVDEDLLEEVWAVAIVARSCLNPRPSRRPLIRYVLKALENPLKVVRHDNSDSARLRPASSRGSWNARGVFGSWGHSISDAGNSSINRPANCGGAAAVAGVEPTCSQRRQGSEVFPEPPAEEEGGV